MNFERMAGNGHRGRRRRLTTQSVQTPPKGWGRIQKLYLAYELQQMVVLNLLLQLVLLKMFPAAAAGTPQPVEIVPDGPDDFQGAIDEMMV